MADAERDRGRRNEDGRAGHRGGERGPPAGVGRGRGPAWRPARRAHRGQDALERVTCIRLDASVVTCHSDKELAEPNFKGFGYHPLLAYCDNTGEPVAGMLRKGSAGSTTVAVVL